MEVMAFAIKMNALIIEWHILPPPEFVESCPMLLPRALRNRPPNRRDIPLVRPFSFIQCTPAKC
jgi:hypothetical protein